ncbi:MAG: 6,7-dimethyl-8-ribityllumazine synthase [Bdellovibrionales bacterium]|nr:6,7-dimethyl-8-ribityllumazine synthase [Bdellovibrionales bacterium]
MKTIYKKTKIKDLIKILFQKKDIKMQEQDSFKKKFQVGIICSEFNRDLVEKLHEGAKKELLKHSIKIAITEWVPGAGEIPQACKWLIEKQKLDGILTCGAIIRGETCHFESLCRILEKGQFYLQTHFSLPVVFSILMLENRSQAENRLGGNKGHRGTEAAQTLIKMLQLKRKINEME